MGGKERFAQVCFKTPGSTDRSSSMSNTIYKNLAIGAWEHYTGQGIKIGQFEPRSILSR